MEVLLENMLTQAEIHHTGNLKRRSRAILETLQCKHERPLGLNAKKFLVYNKTILPVGMRTT
jgi:hypothetical protein